MRNIILITFGFACYYAGFSYFEEIMLFIDRFIHYRLASYFLTYIVIGIPAFLLTKLVDREALVFQSLGLGNGLLIGVAAAFIFVLPLLLGCIFRYPIAKDIAVPNLIAKSVIDPFFEELFFRGYFFGLLFRNTRLGYIPAILFCSLIFASGHLYQGHDPLTLIGIFLTTFLGSVLFAWLFVEWQYNLWVPVFLHVFMNGCWYVFAVSDNALGTGYSNIFRAITIAFSILLTLAWKRKRGEMLLVNRSTLFLKTVDYR